MNCTVDCKSETLNNPTREIGTQHASGIPFSDQPHLTSEFRLTMYVMERLAQHEQLLHQVLDGQHCNNMQLISINRQVATSAAETCQHFDDKISSLLSVFTENSGKVLSTLTKNHGEIEQWHKAHPWKSGGQHGKICGSGHEHPRTMQCPKTGCESSEHMPLCPALPSCPGNCDKLKSEIMKQANPGPAYILVKSNIFETVCTAVILANAMLITINAEDAIKHALQNPGHTYKISSDFIRLSPVAFAIFYCFELSLKLWVYRRRYFTNSDWKWNCLDFILVLAGVYDIVSILQLINFNAAGISWMRLLRIVKMTKMLRVVKAMRIFRELRVMIAAIFGCISTLGWAILMMALIMYVFSLCLLQGVTSYLEDGSVDPNTHLLIKKYWSSVYQATVTLYMAITGGSDWEPLAEPLKAAGEVYHMVFLFYIAFSAVAVLNVLTGLFVDNAMKVATQEDLNAQSEVIQKEQEMLEGLERTLLKVGWTSKTGTVTFEQLQSVRQDTDFQEFCKVLEINFDDVRDVFDGLHLAGEVKFDEFVRGCTKIKDDVNSLDLIGIRSDVSRAQMQNAQFMHYVHDRFVEMDLLLQQVGAPPSTAKPLSERLADVRCLPSSWVVR